ncbi:hypothetical protein BRD05_01465 [Halobacteriales archaeon QS_9_70_65]|nr:MAG: hypothetical protein BRD05_01465 [Halobacteriales archaeon QS_9_70_65]
MGLLPPPEPGVSTGPSRIHPPVETRVEHLKSTTESAETERRRPTLRRHVNHMLIYRIDAARPKIR